MEMIDWVTCKIPFFYTGSLDAGQILSITQNGEVEYSIGKRLPVVGSYDSRLHIRTEEYDAERNTVQIQLSGNPVKFLQGHNLFGTSDLLNLMYETILKLSYKLGAPQPTNVLEQIKSGYYTVSRIDINRMFSLNNRAAVLSFINVMASNSRTKAQASVMKGQTVYFNKESKRWSVKMYSKGQEINLPRNKKAGGFIMPPELLKWADNKIRIELTLSSNELRERGLHLASEWRNIEELDIFTDYVERIQMASQTKINNLNDKIQLASVRVTYQLWLDGNDPRLMLSKRTFYRHRKALLEHDVDISILNTKEQQDTSKIVPLCKVLELKPAEFPHWVSGTEFLFEPRKMCN
jgi:II/X family phage/plasmid replication protein